MSNEPKYYTVTDENIPFKSGDVVIDESGRGMTYIGVLDNYFICKRYDCAGDVLAGRQFLRPEPTKRMEWPDLDGVWVCFKSSPDNATKARIVGDKTYLIHMLRANVSDIANTCTYINGDTIVKVEVEGI